MVNQTGGSETHIHESPLSTIYTGDAWYVGWTNDFGWKENGNYNMWGSIMSLPNENIPCNSVKVVQYTSVSRNISPYTVVYMYKRTA